MPKKRETFTVAANAQSHIKAHMSNTHKYPAHIHQQRMHTPGRRSHLCQCRHARIGKYHMQADTLMREVFHLFCFNSQEHN